MVKKIVSLLLAMMIVLSLAACGETTAPDPSDGSTPSATQEQNETPSVSSKSDETAPAQSNNTQDDALSVAGFLSVYGLPEDDIKPEHFVAFGELTMDGSAKAGEIDSTGYIVITVDKEKTQEEQVRAWFEQIYAKMQSLSADGKLHKNALTIGAEGDEEATLEALFSGPLWESYPGTMWSYPCQLSNGAAKLNVSTSYSYENGEYKMSITVFGE